VFLVDVLPQIGGNIPDVPLSKKPVAINNNAFRFHLQGPLNVHAHDLSNEDPNKQAIHYPRSYFYGDLCCVPGTIPLPDLAVNNKAVLVCMSRAVVHDLCYVSHVVQVLHIEFASATPLFGVPVLCSCKSWLGLPKAVGKVLPLYVVLLRPTFCIGVTFSVLSDHTSTRIHRERVDTKLGMRGGRDGRRVQSASPTLFPWTTSLQDKGSTMKSTSGHGMQ
jgi:hypothetical protein